MSIRITRASRIMLIFALSLSPPIFSFWQMPTNLPPIHKMPRLTFTKCFHSVFSNLPLAISFTCFFIKTFFAWLSVELQSCWVLANWAKTKSQMNMIIIGMTVVWSTFRAYVWLWGNKKIALDAWQPLSSVGSFVCRNCSIISVYGNEPPKKKRHKNTKFSKKKKNIKANKSQRKWKERKMSPQHMKAITQAVLSNYWLLNFSLVCIEHFSQCGYRFIVDIFLLLHRTQCIYNLLTNLTNFWTWNELFYFFSLRF